MHPYMITDMSITVFVDGEVKIINSEHTNFNAVRECIKENRWDDIVSLMDVAKSIVSYSDGNIEVKGGEVYFNGEVLHNVVTNRVLDMQREGFDFGHMLNFLNKLMDNPSRVAVEELYLWLEANGLVITKDGDIIGFKGIRNDFTDKRTGTISNKVGEVVSMPRNQVDDIRDRTCSHGLHFGTLDYATSWAGSDGVVVVVKVNPADVVSIPSDHGNSKARCCRYEVLEVYAGNKMDMLYDGLYDADVDDYDDSWLDDDQDWTY